MNTANTETIIARTRCWIEKAVIGINLCPFARKPQEAGRVRYVVSEAREPQALLAQVQEEFERLREWPASEVETTVLIHPWVLNDFYDYNDFLGEVDRLIERGGYGGEFQVASLHPDYQFAGTEVDDAENYTNRSPYPILHLLREASLAEAVASYARPDKIPERNISTMEKLGAEHRRALLAECMEIEA